jgi:ribosomal protein S18 acetylase RimI-like enzyme
MTLSAGYKEIPVKTWFLAYQGKLPALPFGEDSITIKRWESPSVAEYLEIYKAVGSVWGWTGRLLKTAKELAEILNSANNEVWLFQVENEVAGFFELVRSESETEIVYLGLKPEWIGKGLGQKLIQASVSAAGQSGERVWLHTCERDHPSALQTYLKAGFRIEKEIISLEYYPE